MTLLDTALKLLGSAGMPVFPVGRDKKPLIAWKPYQNRLPTEEEVKAWWNQHPYANIGMATGHLSGIVVIDCDSEDAARKGAKIISPPVCLKAHPKTKENLKYGHFHLSR